MRVAIAVLVLAMTSCVEAYDRCAAARPCSTALDGAMPGNTDRAYSIAVPATWDGHAPLGGRRGVADDVDVGVRVFTVGVAAQVGRRLARGAWTWAVAPAIAIARTRDSVAIPEALFGFARLRRGRAAPRRAMVAGAGAARRAVTRAAGHRRRGPPGLRARRRSVARAGRFPAIAGQRRRWRRCQA